MNQAGKVRAFPLKRGCSPHQPCWGHLVQPVCYAWQGRPGGDSTVHTEVWRWPLGRPAGPQAGRWELSLDPIHSLGFGRGCRETGEDGWGREAGSQLRVRVKPGWRWPGVLTWIQWWPPKHPGPLGMEALPPQLGDTLTPHEGPWQRPSPETAFGDRMIPGSGSSLWWGHPTSRGWSLLGLPRPGPGSGSHHLRECIMHSHALQDTASGPAGSLSGLFPVTLACSTQGSRAELNSLAPRALVQLPALSPSLHLCKQFTCFFSASSSVHLPVTPPPPAQPPDWICGFLLG